VELLSDSLTSSVIIALDLTRIRLSSIERSGTAAGSTGYAEAVRELQSRPGDSIVVCSIARTTQAFCEFERCWKARDQPFEAV